MTIAISLKVNDGLVLAADSAATLAGPNGDVTNVYNNANKVFNLRKGLPIGFISWGAGSIGTASIATLLKDLRRRLSGGDPDHLDWEILRNSYKIGDVADQVRQYIYEELYVPTYENSPSKPALGCIVAGYSAGDPMAEEYQIVVTDDGSCSGPNLLRPRDQPGLTWGGDPEAIQRLVLGHGAGLPVVLEQHLGVPHDQVAPAVAIIEQALSIPLVASPMPIQDAIALAEFLVEVAIKFSRFRPGAATVGGPIEIAAITKHEGFKWIRRKFYYSREMNPEDGDGRDHHH